MSCHELLLLHACLWTNVGSFSSPGWAGSWEYFLSLHARNITPAAINQLFLSLQLLLKIWRFLQTVLSIAKGRDREQPVVDVMWRITSTFHARLPLSGRRSSRCECSGEPTAVVRECYARQATYCRESCGTAVIFRMALGGRLGGGEGGRGG